MCIDVVHPEFATLKWKTRPKKCLVFYILVYLQGLRKCVYIMCLHENTCFCLYAFKLCPLVHFIRYFYIKRIKNSL